MFLIAFSLNKWYIISACFMPTRFLGKNPSVNFEKNNRKTEVFNMSRVCNICGKGQASGNNVSHSNRKTRRTFKVNVQKISYVEDGKEMNGYVCARCIRTLKKADAE